MNIALSSKLKISTSKNHVFEHSLFLTFVLAKALIDKSFKVYACYLPMQIMCQFSRKICCCTIRMYSRELGIIQNAILGLQLRHQKIKSTTSSTKFLHNVNNPILKHLCKLQVDISINARVISVQSLENIYTVNTPQFEDPIMRTFTHSKKPFWSREHSLLDLNKIRTIIRSS